jgi:hypothetical protein
MGKLSPSLDICSLHQRQCRKNGKRAGDMLCIAATEEISQGGYSAANS